MDERAGSRLMLAPTFTPKSEQPERSKPRLSLDSFAGQAKEVINRACIFEFLSEFKAS